MAQQSVTFFRRSAQVINFQSAINGGDAFIGFTGAAQNIASVSIDVTNDVVALDGISFGLAGGGVPEPTTRAPMIPGMGAGGGAMRRRAAWRPVHTRCVSRQVRRQRDMGSVRFMRLIRLWSAVALLLVSSPASAAVTIAFWSRDFGTYFPHAFFTLRGTPDAGGAVIDASYGFTARSITPKLLFGNVGGRVEAAKRSYMNGSHARFAVTLSDAQYARVLDLIRAWDEKTGDPTYNLGKRNCVHFVREAAVIAGLSADFPKLMKKPGGYLLSVAAANAGRVTVIERGGKEYLSTLPPISGTAPVAVPTGTPGAMPGRKQSVQPADEDAGG